MNYILKVLLISSTGIWLGMIIGVAYISTPAIFLKSDSNRKAGEIVSAIFPPFHIIGLICGITALLSTARINGISFSFLLYSTALLFQIIQTMVVMPRARIHRLRYYEGGDEAEAKTFKRWHLISMLLLQGIVAILAISIFFFPL